LTPSQIGQLHSHFRVVADETDSHLIDQYLSQGTAWLALVIPAGLEVALEQGGLPTQTNVQILADGSDANSSGIALAYALGLVRDYNGELLAARGVRVSPMTVSVRGRRSSSSISSLSKTRTLSKGTSRGRCGLVPTAISALAKPTSE